MKRVAQQFSNDNVSPKLAPGLNGQALQPELIGVATVFVDQHQARSEADYDTMPRFTRWEVLDLLDRAEPAIANRHLVRKIIQADIFLAALLPFRNMRI